MFVLVKDKNMCTRYYIDEDTPEFNDAIEKALSSPLYTTIKHKYATSLHCRGEIRPTDIVPVIAPNKNGNRSAYPMKWGFTLKEGKAPVINARVETAHLKDFFSDSWSRRRCIIPASWYYEWEHLHTSDGKTKTGSKYLIQPKGSMSTWLCGLYRYENDLPVFTILTCEPTKEVSRIHDRMPLMLPSEKIDDWICPGSDPNSLLKYAVTDLFIGQGDNIPDIDNKTDWYSNKS